MAEVQAAEQAIREAAAREDEARRAYEAARELAARASLEKGAAQKRASDVSCGRAAAVVGLGWLAVEALAGFTARRTL